MKWQQSIPFTPEASADTLGRLPETPAVFLLRSDDPNADPYINKTANLRRRLERLLSAASPDSKRCASAPERLSTRSPVPILKIDCCCTKRCANTSRAPIASG